MFDETKFDRMKFDRMKFDRMKFHRIKFDRMKFDRSPFFVRLGSALSPLSRAQEESKFSLELFIA
jgi:hypothetical protein